MIIIKDSCLLFMLSAMLFVHILQFWTNGESHSVYIHQACVVLLKYVALLKTCYDIKQDKKYQDNQW